jgi:hypothetical protein
MKEIAERIKILREASRKKNNSAEITKKNTLSPLPMKMKN